MDKQTKYYSTAETNYTCNNMEEFRNYAERKKPGAEVVYAVSPHKVFE